jgi:integrase
MDAAIKKHGGTTANHMVGVLSHAYTKAIEWGQCRDHPIKGKVIKRKVIVKRRVPEMHHIEAAMSILTDKQGMLRHYIELKLMTGLRMTDMLSLRRSDIKPDGLHVTPSKTANSTGKSLIFEYDDNNLLWGTLESIKGYSKYIKSIYLFSNGKGQPYINLDADSANYKSCNGFQSMWQRWQNKALKTGVLEWKFSEKSIRNRVGSDSSTAEEAAERLGHSSTATTRKHYRNSPSKVQPMVKK